MHGTVNLIKELMLENAGGVSSTSYYGGYAAAIELEDCVYRFLQNRDVTFETDIQHPADDFYKDQYIAEVGIKILYIARRFLYGINRDRMCLFSWINRW